MEDAHLLYVDRLTDDRVEKIACSLSPAFMEIEEKDLSYTAPVDVKGEAYLASDHLVVHLDVQTAARLPCKTCNETLTRSIHISHLYHTTPLSELKQAIFDIRGILRETILLESPQFAECEEANCPHRVQYAEYLSKETDSAKVQKDEHSNYPFAHLDEELKKNEPEHME